MREELLPKATKADPARVERAGHIMLRFAERTGLRPVGPGRRYLWTDAFAVCNLLGLAAATGQRHYADLALALVDAVHGTLGRHRPDDPRRGWLSGLPDEEAAEHPTRGGLRIGKELPERKADQPFDANLEWERDGQYFHYLTKWMHALDQVAHYTRQPHYNRWARELAETAHAAFVRQTPGEPRDARMCWKMSTDLSRPLVASMGQHDPLDGFVTALQLRVTASTLADAPVEPRLSEETASFARMVDPAGLTTIDSLGIGGLLADACRIDQLGSGEHDELLRALLDAALQGLRHSRVAASLRAPAERRLAFRELGLAIGLRGVSLIRERRLATATGELRVLLDDLDSALGLASEAEGFWLDPGHQASPSWRAHRDINDVMLATSLLSEGVLRLSFPNPKETP